MRLTDPADDERGGSIEAELNLGVSMGLEPQAIFSDDAVSGVVVTRSSSWWNHTRCATCGHTFRRGDRALVDAAARTVTHLVPGLGCGSGSETADAQRTGDLSDRDEFAEGLLSTWPPTVPVTRLGRRDWRIPRPGSPRQPPTCLYCGHTFRPGEYVVVCPCQPGSPSCAAAVHRDPAAGLPCWDRWQPTGKLAVCPITMARL